MHNTFADMMLLFDLVLKLIFLNDLSHVWKASYSVKLR